MTSLLDLYLLAEKYNIPVEAFHMPNAGSMSIQEGTDCFVGIDPLSLINDADERVKLAHELGHCLYGGFYNRYSRCDIIEKHERAADKWAIKKLIPKDELEAAFQKGYTEVWELADYFDVTEDFVRKAAREYGYLN